MKQRSRANALLIELVLVIFFFMLGSTVLVRLFADARHRTIQARATNVSMAAAQNVVEELKPARKRRAERSAHSPFPPLATGSSCLPCPPQGTCRRR